MTPDGLRTPAGYRKIEAYTNGEQIVCIEWPEDDDEAHDCDALGCSSFSHVKYRAEIPEWQRAQRAPEPPQMEAPRAMRDFGPWRNDPCVVERRRVTCHCPRENHNDMPEAGEACPGCGGKVGQ